MCHKKSFNVVRTLVNAAFKFTLLEKYDKDNDRVFWSKRFEVENLNKRRFFPWKKKNQSCFCDFGSNLDPSLIFWHLLNDNKLSRFVFINFFPYQVTYISIIPLLCLKMGNSRLKSSFNTVDNKQMFKRKFADDWIRNADLWCWKRLLCQLSHNHCHCRV